MPIELATNLVPRAGTATFLVEDVHVRGGYQIRPTLEARDAIVQTNRKAGMVVYVVETAQAYKLCEDRVTWVSLDAQEAVCHPDFLVPDSDRMVEIPLTYGEGVAPTVDLLGAHIQAVGAPDPDLERTAQYYAPIRLEGSLVRLAQGLYDVQCEITVRIAGNTSTDFQADVAQGGFGQGSAWSDNRVSRETIRAKAVGESFTLGGAFVVDAPQAYGEFAAYVVAPCSGLVVDLVTLRFSKRNSWLHLSF